MIGDEVLFDEIEDSEENDILNSRRNNMIKISLINFLKRTKLAESNEEASHILVGIGIVFFVATIFLIIYGFYGLSFLGQNKTQYFIPDQYKSSLPKNIQQKI